MTDNYFHVVIEEPGQKERNYEFNYTENDLIEQVVNSYLGGTQFYFDGEFRDPFSIKIPRIFKTDGRLEPIDFTYDGTQWIESVRELQQVIKDFSAYGKPSKPSFANEYDAVFHKFKIEDVTRKYIKSPTGGSRAVKTQSEEAVGMQKETPYDPKRVFIVHGHDDTSKYQLAEILRQLNLDPVILHTQANAGRTIVEKFEEQTINIGYAFVLLTPDDLGGSTKENLKPRARQNVILELGYFMGKLGRARVCCIYRGDLETPSDIVGIAYYSYQNKVEECFGGIARELKEAKYIS